MILWQFLQPTRTWCKRKESSSFTEKISSKDPKNFECRVFFVEAHPYLFSGSKKPRQSCRKRRRCPGRQIPGGKSAHDSGCETWSAEEKYSWWGWRRFFLVTLTRMKILVRLMATRSAQIMVSAPQERLKQIRASAFGTLWKSKPISTWKLWKGDFKR